MAKRSTRRFALELADDSASTRLEDLSEGGMKILSNTVFAIDQQFRTQIGTPDGAVQVRARIVRSCLSPRHGFRYEYGAQIQTVTEDDRDRLLGFLEHLGESASALPEDPGQEDLSELKQRIASLQEEIEALTDRQEAAQEKQRRDSGGYVVAGLEIDEAAFSTSFGIERFRHLAELDQPMILLVDDPASGLVGKRYREIAEALTDPFDLSSLTKKLRGVVPRKAVPETLFELYERRRIDFA